MPKSRIDIFSIKACFQLQDKMLILKMISFAGQQNPLN